MRKQKLNFLPWISVCCLVTVLFACGVKKSVQFIPDVSSYDQTQHTVTKISDTLSFIGKNYLIKNRLDQWELRLAGDPYQRGLIYGELNKQLIDFQDSVFFEKINTFISSEKKLKMISGFLKFYNRNLYKNIPDEYLAEIYGVSQNNDGRFNQLVPPFLTALYLHGAHDIGHALQDLMLVGCSSMAVWGDKTADGKLLIGRNFDFYAGDDFAKNKLITFMQPDEGHAFMSVSWPGMMGVVSGMNVTGLTATINAGKSKIPLSAKTPISILVREIIQYAATIDEAIAIAKKRKVFVSESIMVGSATDNRVVIIEVSPKKMDVYEVKNEDKIVCSNHFQSKKFSKDRRNNKWKAESHSMYRYQKMEELLAMNEKVTPQKMVDFLRDTKGLDNASIGYGNEKALNQLLAHHGIVFKPAEKLVWVSSAPYQLGEFVAYDLNKIFAKNDTNFVLLETERLNIPADPFIQTAAFDHYEMYRKRSIEIAHALEQQLELSPNQLEEYIQLNPDFWDGYYQVGNYYYQRADFAQAIVYFEQALTKEITTLPAKKMVQKQLNNAKKKSK